MKQHFQIKGMTCQHCRQAAERALSEVPGVQSASVDLDSHSAAIEGSATLEQLREAVEEAGFELLSAAE
ncbi:heavy-metal-associated domain-containing protein [bacterium]|nr:heavy-metal-associated domain-containing protein [bacterium]